MSLCEKFGFSDRQRTRSNAEKRSLLNERCIHRVLVSSCGNIIYLFREIHFFKFKGILALFYLIEQHLYLFFTFLYLLLLIIGNRFKYNGILKGEAIGNIIYVYIYTDVHLFSLFFTPRI